MTIGASLENEILIIFENYGALRPSEIRDRLQKTPPYQIGNSRYYAPRVFDVIIARVVKRLREKGYIKPVKELHNLKVYALTTTRSDPIFLRNLVFFELPYDVAFSL